MKKFISIFIALFAILTIQAQQYSLDKTFINMCVVQQHIDVGVTLQTNNFYIAQTVLPRVNTFYYEVQPTAIYTTNSISYYASYTEQYRRGVGLINDNVINRNNYIRTTQLVNVDTQNNYQNVQKYYCNNILKHKR